MLHQLRHAPDAPLASGGGELREACDQVLLHLRQLRLHEGGVLDPEGLQGLVRPLLHRTRIVDEERHRHLEEEFGRGVIQRGHERERQLHHQRLLLLDLLGRPTVLHGVLALPTRRSGREQLLDHVLEEARELLLVRDPRVLPNRLEEGGALLGVRRLGARVEQHREEVLRKGRELRHGRGALLFRRAVVRLLVRVTHVLILTPRRRAP
mmetsp:Transcript_15809/g.36918  ORF Transcript_15809/g.36918 Transcript_15809/m.36918 type:complete len:209 (-) Transcript_15809:969-1595(-)